MKISGVEMSFVINPNECQAGKPVGFTFRTGAHERRKNNARRDRRDWRRDKRDF